MHPTVARVQAVLRERGLPISVVELGASARTAAEAAAAVGVGVGQIVKSLVFMAGAEPVLVLVSGSNQADEARLGALLGHPVQRASATEVRTVTGFAIGGVPPVGHARPLRVLIDRDLLTHDRLFAAAGHPRAVFALSPADLRRITGGEPADVKRRDSRESREGGALFPPRGGDGG